MFIRQLEVCSTQMYRSCGSSFLGEDSLCIKHSCYFITSSDYVKLEIVHTYNFAFKYSNQKQHFDFFNLFIYGQIHIYYSNTLYTYSTVYVVQIKHFFKIFSNYETNECLIIWKQVKYYYVVHSTCYMHVVPRIYFLYFTKKNRE